MFSKTLLCLSFAFLLVACGPPPEPEVLEGEDQAGKVVVSFLRAVESGSFDKARALLFENTDYILADLKYCRELFFPIKATGITVLDVGHELYGNKWHIAVDVKINYGDQMKPLRFTLSPGEIPLLRGVNPLK